MVREMRIYDVTVQNKWIEHSSLKLFFAASQRVIFYKTVFVTVTKLAFGTVILYECIFTYIDKIKDI